MRGLAGGLLALALAGCAGERVVTVTVEVPVLVYCEAREVAAPVLPTEALRPGDDVFVVTRALWAEIDLREAYEIRLRDALEQCKKKGADSRPPSPDRPP